MRLKSVNEGAPADLSGFLLDPLEDALVAQVHPVEIPDGQDGILKFALEIFFFPDDLHKSFLSRDKAKINLSAFQVGRIYPHFHSISQANSSSAVLPQKRVPDRKSV